MHSWESMPPINYEQSWCDTALTTKIDPPTPNIKRKFATRMRKNSTSNECFSPQKTDETDFQNSYFEHQTFNTFSGMPRALGFNPLTPPGYPNAIFSNTSQQQDSLIQEQVAVSHQGKSIFFNNFSKVDSTTSLTPSHTPPMDVTPPKSPKLKSENLEKEADTNSNCIFSGDDSRSNHSDNDDESIRMPTVNSHGKYKKFKCKQCKFVAVTKLHFWEHTKEHIRPEKMLKCLKCPFVTEYKHHLEYHLRNHDGTKPFQCGKCSYSCVNKSMLNSHLKSHSNIYQYRCADCSYATKYCHSLKLHLRKYKHKPAMVLNEDGTPNPLPIIDVYGTRRGPKMKSGKKKTSQKQKKSSESTNIPNATLASMLLECDNNDQPHASNILPNVLPNTLANMFQNNGHLPFLPYLNINLHMLAAQQQAALAKLSPSTGHEGNRQPLCDSSDEDCDRLDDINNIEEDLKRGVMDLSHTISLKPNIILDTSKNTTCSEAKIEFNQSIVATPTLSSAKVTHRRKGRAFKLDLETPKDENDECHEEASNKTISNKTDHSDISTSNLIHCDEINSSSVTSPVRIENSRCCNNLSASVKLFECKFCEISFKDAVLYTIHMGYHGYNDVFKCNMCGEKCDDRVGFFLHIARNSHS